MFTCVCVCVTELKREKEREREREREDRHHDDKHLSLRVLMLAFVHDTLGCFSRYSI